MCIQVTDSVSLPLLDGGPGNKKYLVRLLTYLPGTPVAKVATTPQVFYEIGKLAASLDTALAEVGCHPCSLTIAQ